MGSSADAHLAYGYDLGSGEDFKAAERGEYDSPKLPWLPVDEDGYTDCSDFGEKVEKHLLASVGFTDEWSEDETAEEREARWRRHAEAQKRISVELAFSGHHDYSGWVLIAKESKRSVEWSEVMAVDLDELATRPAYEGWDQKLSDALAALGITPNQDGPKWLVFPSYG